MSCFLLVLVIWVFSVCLHEYGHAKAAELGGDYTVREKGYLSMNPIYYAHPVNSVLLPIIFMMMGGIGLPGGAVYIRRDLLRSKEWETGVSLAGPAMNVVLSLIIALLLRFVFLPYFPGHPLTYGMAFLLELQISAVLFNLIPMPPLDGFGALEPWLPSEWLDKMDWLRNNGMFLLFILFWYIKPLNLAFWFVVDVFVSLLGVDPSLSYMGFRQFQFWNQ